MGKSFLMATIFVGGCALENSTAGSHALENAGPAHCSCGVEDANDNGCADECAPTPLPDPTGTNRVRFLSLRVPSAHGPTALRVRLTSLHHVNPPYTGATSIPFTQFEGQWLYVGSPGEFAESTATNAPRFAVSYLQHEPYYRDWSSIELLHVTGAAVVPSSSYDVENLAASCVGHEATCAEVSAPLSIATLRWGDVNGDGCANFGDVAALVDKYKNTPGAPVKARALLAGVDAGGHIHAWRNVDFGDIAAAVSAYKGGSYPYKPGTCSNDPTTACLEDAECGDGMCALCLGCSREREPGDSADLPLIDARQPHLPGNPDALQGWSSVTMTFDAAHDVSAEDFTIACRPTDSCPTISAVNAVEQTATITLSRVIPAGAWTCVTHTDTAKQVCLGSLPADADSDGTAAPQNLLDIIDNLNGTRSLPLAVRQCDIDRSGLCAQADVGVERDLLQGLTGFVPWNGKVLPRL